MNYDPPLVTEVRRIAIPSLTATRLERFRPGLERIARDLLANLPTGRADLVPGFTAPFPFLVLCQVFGIADADRPMLHEWMRTIFDEPRAPGTSAVVDQLDEFVTAEIDRRLAEPGPDIWSDIATAWRAQHTVSRPQLISLCAMLLLAGFDSAAQAIANCVIAWLTHAELRARVESDPVSVPAAVDEILRRDSPGLFATLRRASTDIEVGSTTIPAGARVLLSIAAANRDPHRYSGPDQLDLDRGAGDRHLAFGLGPHFCPGSALAGLEVGVALAEFARAYPAARLAVASTELRWRGTYAGRRLVELPVWTI
jgi:cytochrome P450